MKILYPHQEATSDEIEELLRFAIEGRSRVKDQLLRIDNTYAPVRFVYTAKAAGTQSEVKTLEEEQYPRLYGPTSGEQAAGGQADGNCRSLLHRRTRSCEQSATPAAAVAPAGPAEGHLTFQENQRGVTYDALFGPYLAGAQRIRSPTPTSASSTRRAT